MRRAQVGVKAWIIWDVMEGLQLVLAGGGYRGQAGATRSLKPTGSHAGGFGMV